MLVMQCIGIFDSASDQPFTRLLPSSLAKHGLEEVTPQCEEHLVGIDGFTLNNKLHISCLLNVQNNSIYHTYIKVLLD